MKIAIRVDASTQIGTGHFMRCLTLADALKQQGAQLRFISRHLPEHLCAMLTRNGHEHVLIESAVDSIYDELAHAAWLGVNQSQDAADSIRALSDRNWDWLVVDHYALDARWESMLRQVTQKILVIDDIADRQHDCDVLLDQNFYTDMEIRYKGKVPVHCQLLLGPRYALLRDEFRCLREQVQPRTGRVQRILVLFGGVDADNYTGLAIRALVELAVKDLHVDVVIGAQHPCRVEIEASCAEHGYVCHVQTARMAELMAAADLAIGAGGSATWERCCLGLPTLAICVADNQHRQIADAAVEGLLYAPMGSDDLVSVLKSHIKALLENAPLLKLISTVAMKAVDGDGVFRVIQKLGDAEIWQSRAVDVSVRLAEAHDATLVWPWRNHESTRRYFFDPSPVSLETHVAWWNRSLCDSQRVLLLGSSGGQEIGVIRFDLEQSKRAVISIYLDPGMTGKGMGRALLRAGLNWLQQSNLEINTVVAEIIPENSASLRAFQSAGFCEQYRVLAWKA